MTILITLISTILQFIAALLAVRLIQVTGRWKAWTLILLSQLHMVLTPQTGNAWMFGVHQCSYSRQWTDDEKNLFREIGHRLSDGLNGLLFLRGLQKSEQRFRTLLAASPVAVYETDVQCSCLYVNDNWQKLAGLTLEESLGDGWKKALHKEDRDHIVQLWKEHMQSQEPWNVEYRFCTPEGKVSWEGHTFRVSVSIGMVAITETTFSLTKILQRADAACYMAKDAGRNRIHIYHQDDAETTKRHGEMRWVERLHRAFDDFGSGLSSFGYLKNLPVDYLKIDGMFVKDIVDDPIDYAMVKSINEIGQVMGMKTIAEFVENDEIKGMLQEIGVNYAQGYGVGKPIAFNELLELSNQPE